MTLRKHGGHNKLTIDEAELARLWNEGVPGPEIGRRLGGISKEVVRIRAMALGLSRRRATPQRKPKERSGDGICLKCHEVFTKAHPFNFVCRNCKETNDNEGYSLA